MKGALGGSLFWSCGKKKNFVYEDHGQLNAGITEAVHSRVSTAFFVDAQQDWSHSELDLHLEEKAVHQMDKSCAELVSTIFHCIHLQYTKRLAHLHTFPKNPKAAKLKRWANQSIITY